MAQLPEVDRKRVWRGLMRWWSNLREALGALSKADLQAAVDATDTWIDNNQASYNQALPEAARTALTQSQKTLLFCSVAAMRVSVGFLRKLFGEVD
jgi:hypothetical protein